MTAGEAHDALTAYWRPIDDIEAKLLKKLRAGLPKLKRTLRETAAAWSQGGTILAHDEVEMLHEALEEREQTYRPAELARRDQLTRRRIRRDEALRLMLLLNMLDWEAEAAEIYEEYVGRMVRHVAGDAKIPAHSAPPGLPPLIESLGEVAEWRTRQIVFVPDPVAAVAQQVEMLLKDLLRVSRTGNYGGILDRAALWEIGYARVTQLKANGVERVRFVAVLDNATTDECRELHGKIFDVDDLVVGKNAPPIYPPPHPCRSILVPV